MSELTVIAQEETTENSSNKEQKEEVTEREPAESLGKLTHQQRKEEKVKYWVSIK